MDLEDLQRCYRALLLRQAMQSVEWTAVLRLRNQRWRRLFGQGPEIFKWKVRGNHAADLIAGSVAKYASSGV